MKVIAWRTAYWAVGVIHIFGLYLVRNAKFFELKLHKHFQSLN